VEEEVEKIEVVVLVLEDIEILILQKVLVEVVLLKHL